MLGWLYRIIVGTFFVERCKHNWEQIKIISVYDEDYPEVGVDLPIKYIYVCKCKHCGEIKSFNVETH